MLLAAFFSLGAGGETANLTVANLTPHAVPADTLANR